MAENIEQSDDIAGNYSVSRQVAEEYNSPAVQGLGASGSWKKESPVPGDPEFKKQGETEDPWVDPVSAGTAAFGGTSASLINKGMKLMPSLGRAMVSGVVGSVAEVPIGIATESVGSKYPSLALPFNILIGIVSGSTVESAIEKRIMKIAGKKAKPEQIADLIGEAKTALQKGESNEITQGVIEDLTGELPVGKAKELEGKIKERELSPVTRNQEDPLRELGWSDEDIYLMSGKDAQYNIDNKRIPADVDTSRFETRVGTGVPKTESKDFADVIPGPPTNTEKYAININMDRIESSDDIDSMIRKTAQTFSSEINEARRGVITNKETEKIADLVGVSVEQLLKRKKGVAFNAEEAVSARRILVSSSDNLSKLANKIASLDATDIDKFEFRKALNMHYAIQSQISGMTAEAGRALQSFNIQAKSSKVKVNQIKDILSKMPGGVSTERMAEAISSFDTPEQVGTFVKQAQRATSVDMFIEAWINGLLSGPQTHAVNMLSNTLNAVWQVPERVLAAGISAVTGSKAISGKEAVAQAYGLIEGFSDGLKGFAKTLKTGESSDIIGKIEQTKYRSITAENVRQLPIIKKLSPNSLQEGGTAARAVDLFGEAVRIPGRALLAEDELFKGVGYRMELRARAVRTAMEEGLEGDAAASRIQNILNDPQVNAPEVHLAAIDAARYQTFTQPLESDILNAISQSRNPVVKIIAPFVRTPTNILKYGLERTPLAPLMKNVKADIAAGGARRDLALARMSLGSMVMATMGTMAAKGMITGGGPSNPEEFSTWRRLNQPYSIKIGNKEYSYNRIEPLGMLFGLAADFTQISGLAGEELQPEIDELAGAIVSAISKNVTSKTWLRGVSESIRALDDPDRYGNKYVQNFIGSMVPSIVAQTERTVNPEIEAVYGMMDAVKARIPGLSSTLPRRRDLWGEPISIAINKNENWAETTYRAISPVYISEGKSSPIDEELLKNKIHIRNTQRVQSFEGVNIELTPDQHEKFIILMNKTPLMSTGKQLKQSLNDMVQNDSTYKYAGSDQKEMMIRAKFLESKEIAKSEWLKAYPEYRMLLDSEHMQMSMGQR